MVSTLLPRYLRKDVYKYVVGLVLRVRHTGLVLVVADSMDRGPFLYCPLTCFGYRACSPSPPRTVAFSESTWVGNRGQQQGFDLQAHASPHIGPDSHCLIAEEVEEVHKLRDEERTDGSNASLATQMQHR